MTNRAAHEERDELIEGLCASDAFISPKFFYDPLGSRLFTAITELDEYYPTRTEAAIMAANTAEIAAAFGARGCTLIDLGAGDCEKASRLFDALRPGLYVGVDISAQFLRQSIGFLQQRFPRVAMHCVGTDFSKKLVLPANIPRESRLFFYPGSSIGNFSPGQAQRFLAMLREQLDHSGGVLLGVDLAKDSATLVAAYNDPLGVTAAFNLNVLRRANRIAGTNFVLGNWRHVALYDSGHGRIEMHLQARRAVQVHWPGGQREFAEGERIHTENSYKYRLEDFAALLGRAGFAVQRHWTDPRQWFAVVLARPEC